eukprot:1998744-Prymnesium_polylepis.2
MSRARRTIGFGGLVQPPGFRDPPDHPSPLSRHAARSGMPRVWHCTEAEDGGSILRAGLASFTVAATTILLLLRLLLLLLHRMRLDEPHDLLRREFRVCALQLVEPRVDLLHLVHPVLRLVRLVEPTARCFPLVQTRVVAAATQVVPDRLAAVGTAKATAHNRKHAKAIAAHPKVRVALAGIWCLEQPRRHDQPPRVFIPRFNRPLLAIELPPCRTRERVHLDRLCDHRVRIPRARIVGQRGGAVRRHGRRGSTATEDCLLVAVI